MSKTYNIGQHLYKGVDNDSFVDVENYYSAPIAIEDYKIINTTRDDGNYYTIIQLENNNYFEVGKCYYFYFELVPSDASKNIYLRYNSDDGLVDDDIIFRKITLESGVQDKTNNVKTYEIIFSPDKRCNQIIFQVESSNIYVSNSLTINNLEIRIVNNLIGAPLGDNTMRVIKELTIEGNENIFFVLNNEDIKIGPNNYYKIYDDYSISFIGFVFNNQNKETSFIMNYKY